jgi:hypothetical protein
VTKENAISWPAHSPDFTPCDFFLWGVIKDNVYKKKARNLLQLQKNICEAFDELKEREDHLSEVMLSLPERYKKCIDLAGGQILSFLVNCTYCVTIIANGLVAWLFILHF